MGTALNVIEILNTVTDENLARRLLGDVEEVSHLARDLGERNPPTGEEEVDALARVTADTMRRLVAGITPAATALFRLAQADAESVTAEDYRREVYAVLDDAHEEVCAVDDALARLHSVAPAGSWAERDSGDSPQLGRLRATVERILALGNPYFLDPSN